MFHNTFPPKVLIDNPIKTTRTRGNTAITITTQGSNLFRVTYSSDGFADGAAYTTHTKLTIRGHRIHLTISGLLNSYNIFLDKLLQNQTHIQRITICLI